MLPTRSIIFIALNIVRVLSMVSLILVFASSIFVMVNDVNAFNAFQNAQQNNPDAANMLANCDYIEGSTIPNQAAGIFWAIVSRLLIIFQVIVLFLSEVGWPASFFDNFFPVLSKTFGLGALGIFQSLIGATILSHHVDDFTLVAAFFLFSLGCLNILLGLIFRESAKDKRSITSWRAETRGILPTHLDKRPVFVNASPAFVSEKMSIPGEFGGANGTFRSMSDASNASRSAGYGFGRQGEKAAGLKGFMISRPVESLPRYAAAPQPVSAASSQRRMHMRRESSVSSASSSSSRRSGSSFASPGSATLNGPYRQDAPPVFKSSSTAI